MENGSKREGWLDAGWARGVFVDVKSFPELLDHLPALLREEVGGRDNVYLIPLLYDCALLDERFDLEPWAQAILCWGCEKPDPNFFFGKNPRRYQFQVELDDEQFFLEAMAVGFCQLPRQALLDAAPSERVVWAEDGLDTLLNWVSERYRQPTFPDEWNKRVATRQKRLKKLWENELFTRYVSGVYFDLRPFAELDSSGCYKVKALMAVPAHIQGKEFREFNREGSSELVERLVNILKTLENVSVEEVDTISETEFTKSMQRDYCRWQLEYYTYKSEHPATLPAELEAQKEE